MKLKQLAQVLALSLVAAAAVAEEQGDTETAVKIYALSPGRSEDWSSGSGVEAQLRFWGETGCGMALAFGYESWPAIPVHSTEEDEHGYMSTSISGSAELLPVGVSWVYRDTMSEQVQLTLEAGLRYLFVDSNVGVEVDLVDDQGAAFIRDTIETDDSILAVFGVGLRVRLAENVTLQAGLGYRLDMVKPREYLLGEEVGRTSFQASSAGLGLAWSY